MCTCIHTHTEKDFRLSQSKISLPRFQAPEIDNGESTEFYVDFCYLFFFFLVDLFLGKILDHTGSPAFDNQNPVNPFGAFADQE